MAPVVAVSFLAAVAGLGLYTYLAPVLAAAGGVGGVAPYLWAWGAVQSAGRAAGDRTGRVRLLVGGVLAVIVVAQALLPSLAAAALPGAVAAPVAWGMAGWALQVPQQHRLPALGAERGTIVLALNNSALCLGSAAGSALGGPALGRGRRRTRCPGRPPGWRRRVWRSTWRRGRGSRVAARVSTLGCYEHS
ncbi:hypothetical protein [Streptomyces nigrescens]